MLFSPAEEPLLGVTSDWFCPSPEGVAVLLSLGDVVGTVVEVVVLVPVCSLEVPLFKLGDGVGVVGFAEEVGLAAGAWGGTVTLILGVGVGADDAFG